MSPARRSQVPSHLHPRILLTWPATSVWLMALMLIMSTGGSQAQALKLDVQQTADVQTLGEPCGCGHDDASDQTLKKRKVRADLTLPVFAPLDAVASLELNPDSLRSADFPLPEGVAPGSLRDPGLRVARGQAPPC